MTTRRTLQSIPDSGVVRHRHDVRRLVPRPRDRYLLEPAGFVADMRVDAGKDDDACHVRAEFPGMDKGGSDGSRMETRRGKGVLSLTPPRKANGNARRIAVS